MRKLMQLINRKKMDILAIVGLISGICYGCVWLFGWLNQIWQIVFATIILICFSINIKLVEKYKKIIFFLCSAVWYVILLLDLIDL